MFSMLVALVCLGQITQCGYRSGFILLRVDNSSSHTVYERAPPFPRRSVQSGLKRSSFHRLGFQTGVGVFLGSLVYLTA